MSILNTIKTKLLIKGDKMGMVQRLNKITDHPRIQVDNNEYKRIDTNLMYFKGEFPNVKYKNTYGQAKERPFVSLNMAQLVAKRLASLIYNEQATLTIANNKQANDYVNQVLADCSFSHNFERYLESALALGGLAMKPYLNKYGKIDISYIQAPVFYPLKVNTNKVSECAIANLSTTTENKKTVYWTQLEFHTWDDTTNNYIIEQELYRSENKDEVGIKVPLESMFDGLQERTEISNLSRPLFTYLVPFGFNNKAITSPIGLSIFDNAHNTLEQINKAYDQFNWEIQLGQRRVVVPDSMAKVVSTETGQFKQVFDTEQNIFISLGGDQDNTDVKDLTTNIRTADYTTAINYFIKVLEMQTGLSTGTFSFDGQGVKTATEVVSENSMTYQTRNSHLNNVTRSIQELIISILELSQLYGLYNGEVPNLEDIKLNFDDGVFLDKSSELDYYTKAVSAGLISKKRAIAKVFDVSEDEAQRIYQDIQDENYAESTSTPTNSELFDVMKDDTETVNDEE